MPLSHLFHLFKGHDLPLSMALIFFPIFSTTLSLTGYLYEL
jgi:hypothetical protein